MSLHVPSFAEVIALIDRMAIDDQQSLMQVVGKRIADEERQRIAASIRSARQQHRKKKTKPVTPEELMREILE